MPAASRGANHHATRRACYEYAHRSQRYVYALALVVDAHAVRLSPGEANGQHRHVPAPAACFQGNEGVGASGSGAV